MKWRIPELFPALLLGTVFFFFSCEKDTDCNNQPLTLEKWKIGAEAKSFQKTYEEPAATRYIFRLTGNSLCPIYGVKARITINNQEVMNKTYDNPQVHSQDMVNIPVPANSIITVSTERFNTGSLIQCIWGGEAFFELEKQ
jgi:hypothetical protein